MLTPHCWAKARGGKIIRDKYLLQLAARKREKAATSQGRTRRGKWRWQRQGSHFLCELPHGAEEDDKGDEAVGPSSHLGAHPGMCLLASLD